MVQSDWKLLGQIWSAEWYSPGFRHGGLEDETGLYKWEGMATEIEVVYIMAS